VIPALHVVVFGEAVANSWSLALVVQTKYHLEYVVGHQKTHRRVTFAFVGCDVKLLVIELTDANVDFAKAG
jgi:hypothetical protein